MPRFLDAVEPLGIDAEGKGVTEGNCKIEVEDIGQGQQLVVLSATKDLKEGRGNHFVEGWGGAFGWKIGESWGPGGVHLGQLDPCVLALYFDPFIIIQRFFSHSDPTRNSTAPFFPRSLFGVPWPVP